MNFKNNIITIIIILTIICVNNGDIQPYPSYTPKQQSTILQPKLTTSHEQKSQNELFNPVPKPTDIKYSQPLVNDNIYPNHKNTPDTFADYSQTDTYNPYISYHPSPIASAPSASENVQNINYDGRVNDNFDSSSSASSYIPNSEINGHIATDNNNNNNNNNSPYDLSAGNYGDQQTAGSNQIRPYLQRQPYNDGYVVQTGYEGYYVPSLIPSQLAPPLPPLATPPSSATTSALSTIANLPIVGRIYRILNTILPISIVDFIMNSSGFVISMLTMLLFGGALTTAVCTLTPLCSISFAAASFPVLGLIGLRDTTKRITEKLGISSESLDRITVFLQNAISKFDAMQVDSGKEESPKNGKDNKVVSTATASPTAIDSDKNLKTVENNSI